MNIQLDPERRKELLDRLEALANMTIANGCSEHEAKVAAAKAAKLMDQFGLSLEEVRAAMPEDAVEIDWVHTGGQKSHPVAKCWRPISRLTHTKIYGDRSEQGKNLTIIGLPADVAVAKFLIELFKTSMEVSWAKHWKKVRKTARYHGRTARVSFMMGMVHRLNERVNQLAAEREAEAAKIVNSRELVVLTQALVEARLKSLGVKLELKRSTRYLPNSHYRAGYKAGGHVSISAGFIED